MVLDSDSVRFSIPAEDGNSSLLSRSGSPLFTQGAKAPISITAPKLGAIIASGNLAYSPYNKTSARVGLAIQFSLLSLIGILLWKTRQSRVQGTVLRPDGCPDSDFVPWLYLMLWAVIAAGSLISLTLFSVLDVGSTERPRAHCVIMIIASVLGVLQQTQASARWRRNLCVLDIERKLWEADSRVLKKLSESGAPRDAATIGRMTRHEALVEEALSHIGRARDRMTRLLASREWRLALAWQSADGFSWARTYMLAWSLVQTFRTAINVYHAGRPPQTTGLELAAAAVLGLLYVLSERHKEEYWEQLPYLESGWDAWGKYEHPWDR